jgi:hypothetical protein
MSALASGHGVHGVELGVVLFFFVVVAAGGFVAARCSDCRYDRGGSESGCTVLTPFADASNALLVTVTKNTITSFAASAFGELIA